MEYKAYVLKDPETLEIRYVGITRRTLQQRMQDHIASVRSKECQKWHKVCWMKNVYARCNKWPIIELIAILDTIEDAKQFEINYIATYKEEYKLTNCTPGGDMMPYRVHSRESILNSNHIRKVDQYNIFGELLHTYDITEDAARALGMSSASKITMCCKKKRDHAHGYIWRYHGEELGDISNIDKESLCFNDLLQYDLQGNLINVWDSYQKASKAIDDHSKGGNIAACVKGRQHICKGFIWKLRYKGERLSKNLSNSADSDTTPSQTSTEEGVTTIEKQETELSRVESSDSKREASKDEDIVCSTWKHVAAKAGKYLRNLLNI